MMKLPLDVRYGLRKLNNNVGFTAVAVACLALGICASVSVFGVVDFFLLRPFPGVTEQGRIVSLGPKRVFMEELKAWVGLPLPHRTFLRYQEANHVLTGLAAYYPVPLDVEAGNQLARINGQIVTDGYFTTLGVQSERGQWFAPGQEKKGEALEAVISHGLWQRLFGSRQQAVGSALSINGRSFVVIGVAPEGFHGTLYSQPADVWVPAAAVPLAAPWLRSAPRADPQDAWIQHLIGRLAPGVDLERAQAEMDLLAARFSEGVPAEARAPALQVFPTLGTFPGLQDDLGHPLHLASAFVGLLMLLVCANLGGLLLVKAAARQEEIGVRLALGVTRGRLVRQLLTESVALALLGGLAGFILALFALESIQGLSLGRFLPRIDRLAVDGRIAAFTVLLSLVAGVLFGLGPALWATRPRAVPLLRPGGEGITLDRGRTRLQEIFVVWQITVSLLLLVSTGLLVRTYQNLVSINPGFDSHNIANLRIDLSHGYSKVTGLAFYDQLLEQVRQSPGVQSAALTLRVPLSRRLDRSEAKAARKPGVSLPVWADANVVSTGHFRTLGIPLLEGRDFRDDDRDAVIVNEALAKALWPGQEPLGKQVALGAEMKVFEVVGVAANVRVSDLQAAPEPYVYLLLTRSYDPGMTLQVRTEGDPRQIAEPLRTILRRLNPKLASELSWHEEEVEETRAQSRLFSKLFGAFSLVALLITAIGLYGTLAYAVRRRTRELGIRMALGARPAEIMGLVIRRGLGLTVIGLALGVLTGVWSTSLLTGFLFGVTPTDPGVFVTVVLLLLLVGFAASFLPAYSATRVDPIKVIRHE